MSETVGCQTSKFLPTIGADAGEFSDFGKSGGPQGDSCRGRFAELMPPHSAPANQQALARRLLDALGLTEAVLRGGSVSNGRPASWFLTPRLGSAVVFGFVALPANAHPTGGTWWDRRQPSVG